LSHVARIELEINDLETLKAACKALGFEFLCDQQTYRWYGTWVGDYPLPQGFTRDDLGKCTHAIRVPGATYEIGVVKRGSKYLLLWDFYQSGGLQAHIGTNGGKLKQAYSVQRIRREAVLKGYHLQEQKTPQGIRIIMTDIRR